MLLSFVIPVYNVERYLKKCVESILAQSFKDYEIILIDDGSTDKSGSICDEYAKSNISVKVIHKDNGGLSDARNCGIRKAQGEYLLFIDSDDYIEKESIKRIVSCLNEQKLKIDLMFLECVKIYPDKIEIPLGEGYCAEKINGRSKKEVLKHLSGLPKFPGSAWGKLIRKDFIIKNNLYFEKGLLSEDIDWTIGVLMKAKNFAYCNTKYYYYRKNREGSITNTPGIKSIECLIYIMRKWSLKNRKSQTQYLINSFMAYEYVVALFNYGNLPRIKKQKVKKDMKELSWVLNYANTRKTKIIKILYKLFGLEAVAQLLRIKNILKD